jgi:hypothetical protein
MHSYIIPQSHSDVLRNRSSDTSSSWKILGPVAISHLFPTQSPSPSHSVALRYFVPPITTLPAVTWLPTNPVPPLSRDVHQSQRSPPSRDSSSNHFHSLHSIRHRKFTSCFRTEGTCLRTAVSQFFPQKTNFSSTTLNGGTFFFWQRHLGHSCLLLDAATLPLFTAATPWRRHHQTSWRHPSFSKLPNSTVAPLLFSKITKLHDSTLPSYKLPVYTEPHLFQNYTSPRLYPSFFQNCRSLRRHAPRTTPTPNPTPIPTRTLPYTCFDLLSLCLLHGNIPPCPHTPNSFTTWYSII